MPQPLRPLNIMGLGHPLLDLRSTVDRLYLLKYGIELGSVNLAEPQQLPVFEELSQRRDVEFVPGGASMNSVRIARWMTPDDAAITVSYVGSLGDDEFGCILEHSLSQANIKSLFSKNYELPTGTCACLVLDTERSLIANLGAAVNFTLDFLRSPAVTKLIEQADIFYAEGFFLNTVSSPTNTVYIGHHCLDRDKILAFNISAPYLCRAFKEQWEVVMPYIDVLFGSQIDAIAYAAENGWSSRDIDDIALQLVALPKFSGRRRLVVITGGSEATVLAVDGCVTHYTPPVVPIEEVVDTNGAGDAFVGGFLSCYARHMPLERCVKAGHAAAGVVIRHVGCVFSGSPPPF